MKGCLIFFGVLIGLVVLAIAGSCGFFVYKAKQSADQFETAFTETRSATDKAFPFAPPATSTLDPARFESALGVRERVGVKFAGVFEKMNDQKEPEGIHDAIGMVFGALTSFRDAFIGVPGDLRRELEAERMSFAEFGWNLETAYGSIFAAADQGDERAKALEEELRDEMEKGPPMQGGKRSDDYAKFRDRAKASLRQFEPQSFETVFAAKERFPGEGVVYLVDTMSIAQVHEAADAPAAVDPTKPPPAPAPESR